jgi:site-specific recombinase XerD
MFKKGCAFVGEKKKLIEDFERHLNLSNLSESSRKSYLAVIKTLCAKGDLIQCGKAWIEDTVSLNPGLKPASKKSYILALRHLYGWLMEIGVRQDNPAKLVKIPHVRNGKPRYFKEHEIQKIFSSVKGVRNRLIIHFLFYCGLRAKELLGLTKQDVDFDSRIIAVTNGKGDKYREVPFPPSMIPLIRTYYRRYSIENHLFFSVQDRDKPLTYEALKCMFRHLGNRLGIHISAHRFRHSFATFLYNRGCDPDTVQNFMGHSDFATTKKYLYVMAATRRLKYDTADLGDIVK